MIDQILSVIVLAGDANISGLSIVSGPIAASGTWTIPDYTNPNIFGTTVTIDSVSLTEGLDWFAATSNTATATSLSNAINSNLDPGIATAGHSNNIVTITATTPGTAGNSIIFQGGPGITSNPNSGTLGGGSN